MSALKERKYKREFRTVTRIDPKTGRERRAAEYTGDWYRFASGSPAGRAAGLAPWMAGVWIALLIYLKTARATGRCMYALLPAIMGLFPAVYGAMGLFALSRSPERMTVVQRENGIGRVMRSGLGCGLLAGIAAAGCALYLSLNGLWAGGFCEFILNAAASACGWAGFTAARRGYDAMIREKGA